MIASRFSLQRSALDDSSIASRDRPDLVALLAIGLLALSFGLGGASAGDELFVAVLELASLPLLLIAGHRLWRARAWRQTPMALALAALILAIPLLQLAPLPYDVWSRLPGRQDAVTALALIGAQPNLPLSLTPEATWRYALALLPPLAVFFAGLGVSTADRRKLVAVVLIGAAANVLLGALQMASGGNPAFYIELASPPDPNVAVGFFGNRNHLASLLVLSLPLAGIFAGSALRRGHMDRRLQIALAVLFALIAIAAIAATRSRAGVLLVGPTLIATMVVAWGASTAAHRKWVLLALGLAIATAIAAVAAFSLSPLMARFDADVGAEARFQVWPRVAAVSEQYLPLGSGIGSFVPVYAAAEPLDQLDEAFWNNAHNDYLEIWLEAGWPGALGVALFVLWWAVRSANAWSSIGSSGSMGRAASITIGLVLLHSLADYPLRTLAVASVFGLSCAMLVTRPTMLGELIERTGSRGQRD